MAHSVTEWLTALQQVMPRGKAWRNVPGNSSSQKYSVH